MALKLKHQNSCMIVAPNRFLGVKFLYLYIFFLKLYSLSLLNNDTKAQLDTSQTVISTCIQDMKYLTNETTVPLNTEDNKVNSSWVIIRAFVYVADVLPPCFSVTMATVPNCESSIRNCYFSKHRIWSAGGMAAGTPWHSIEWHSLNIPPGISHWSGTNQQSLPLLQLYHISYEAGIIPKMFSSR